MNIQIIKIIPGRAPVYSETRGRLFEEVAGIVATAIIEDADKPGKRIPLGMNDLPDKSACWSSDVDEIERVAKAALADDAFSARVRGWFGGR